jgi:peptide-methionine (S)-S-oxide reductase
VFFGDRKLRMPTAAEALPGRAEKMPVPAKHFVNGRTLEPPFPAGLKNALFGLGCFWGAERKFWQAPGVFTTAVGYAAGFTPNPTYREVCTGLTGHNEVVLVVFDPAKVPYDGLLKVFWESHDPTQGMRQGNDAGTQYRSGIYAFDAEQKAAAEASKTAYQARSSPGPATARSRPRSSTRRRSTTPRSTTSSTSRRTRTATAASAARACPVPSASARPREGPQRVAAAAMM